MRVVRKTISAVVCLCICIHAFSQTASRIAISSITPSINTGMDYTPWLNDDTTNLVSNVWSGINNQYVDVKIKLATKANLTTISLYHYEGNFDDNPASIYAINGTTKTLLGTFQGNYYMQWVNITLTTPLLTDTIVIHKYANDIPEKVKIFGTPAVLSTPITGVQKICQGASSTLSNATSGGTWSSSNASVAAISAAGVVSGVSVGTATISYATASTGAAATTVTVSPSPNAGSISGASTVCAPATISLSNTTGGGAWSSTATMIAKVNASGIVTGVAAGTATISYSVTAACGTNAAIKTITVNAIPGTGTITGVSSLCIGGKSTMSDATTGGRWSSSNPAVATIGTTGSLIGLAIGSAAISYTTVNSCGTRATYNVITVTISPNAGSIAGVASVYQGATTTLSNAVSGGTWSSSAAGVATIGAGGVVTGISPGTATISYVVTGGCGTAAAAQIVTVNPTPSGGAGGTLVHGMIPIEAKRWYQLNNCSNGLSGLFDGVLTTAVQTGWGLIYSNYDAYYPVLKGEQINIDSIKFYDGAGSNTSTPFTLYYIDSLWNKVAIATFTGSQYNAWVGPNPSNPSDFSVTVPANNIKYLVINSYGAFPNEMQLYGSYIAPPATTAVSVKEIPMGQEFGVNGFEWNFEDPNNPLVIDPVRMNAAKSFTGLRHYLDWTKLEPNKGGYTFNPSHSGGWNYDTMYAACKANGIEVLADIKTLPDWLVATYPLAQQNSQNIPAPYDSDYAKPSSYLLQAKVAFQFAARYGSNSSVSSSLLSVDGSTRWTNDPANTVKKGLGLVKYVECDNERDKWWLGTQAYQTGRQYAANLSAFYDGNKNTMGPGVGVKNADTSMKVVMCGVAMPNTDYLRGMIDWCKQYRGYNADGSVNLCWDVINYHVYSDNAGSSQGGGTMGASPEAGQLDTIATNFVKAAHAYAQDMPVWVTETGYDINQGSITKAYPVGSKTTLQTQADWILRTSLLHARMGVDRTFFYEMYDDDSTNSTKFASSGLITAGKTRRPAADYLYQANKLAGKYVYKETISTNPLVDRYEYKGQSVYVLVKPTQNGSTMSYTLHTGGSGYVNIYTPAIGQDSMSVSSSSITSGNVALTVSETPVFVIANPIYGLKTVNPETPSPIPASESVIKVFPNPTSGNVNLNIDNDFAGNVEVNIYTEDGRKCGNYSFNKMAGNAAETINLGNLPGGLYLMEIDQNNEKTIKKVLKINP